MMICKITASRYDYMSGNVEICSFNIGFEPDCILKTRFDGVQACLIRGYKSCEKQGLQFEKLEVVSEMDII